jgi:hypothetical protein
MAGGPLPGDGRGEDPVGAQVPGGPAEESTRGADAHRAGERRSGGRRGRGARGFAEGGPLHQALPGVTLVRRLDRASGASRHCEQASDDEAFGLLGRWDAAESWCASAKLGVIRELIRRRPGRGFGTKVPGGLPQAWDDILVHEIGLELGISARAADGLIDLAHTLEARLVLTAAALDVGVINVSKARIIAEATAVLDDARAAAAETLIAGRLAGKTHGQIAAMIARAVVTVDPQGARKRRERAEKEDARVQFWREHAGTAALAAFGLPPDEALVANQHIQDRALEYKAAGVPGTMDPLRVRAFLDAINGTDSRPQTGTTRDTAADAADLSHDGHGGEPAPNKNGCAANGSGSAEAENSGPEHRNAETENAGTGRSGAGNDRVQGGAGLAANVMLIIPAATLRNEAENPGEAHGFGAIDPELARRMTAAAARDPRSTWCVTVTDEHGHAVGHGCAKPARKTKKSGQHGATGNRGSPGQASRDGRDGPFLTFTLNEDGTWRLVIAGREYTVKLVTIPVTSCDHQFESAGYQPSDLLRHLVEVRDGECTQPTCRRSARRCDFEHAVPWHKGGKTCGCNGGCRCRRDHKIKQSPGWTVTQPMPGYHRWTTPAGRSYTSEPMRYPI